VSYLLRYGDFSSRAAGVVAFIYAGPGLAGEPLTPNAARLEKSPYLREKSDIIMFISINYVIKERIGFFTFFQNKPRYFCIFLPLLNSLKI